MMGMSTEMFGAPSSSSSSMQAGSISMPTSSGMMVDGFGIGIPGSESPRDSRDKDREVVLAGRSTSTTSSSSCAGSGSSALSFALG
ncbi:hypothetical protein L208DRAFT_1400789 [Tricholoma matsutake]|nr:hypothetical protein L208DRAFT_1400789 [Tricholoma matsutake 945]